jgi:hypothetical protein
MSLQEWERDIRNRQRNIVFPDTVLNEARFFRNVVSGRAVWNPIQRIGVLLITAPFIFTGCMGIAYSVGAFLTLKDPIGRVRFLIPAVEAFVPLAFGIIVAVRGLLPAPAPIRKRRGGYRQSGRV